MVMDTVTDHRGNERTASRAGRRAAVPLREAAVRQVREDAHAGLVPAAAPHRTAVRAGVRAGPVMCADSHAPDLHGSRLTPRGRLVVAVVWLVMAAVAGLMLATMPGEGSRQPVDTTKVMVEPGETLWQLAGNLQPGAGTHETVATIMSLNDLESASQIRPGDILLVPVQP